MSDLEDEDVILDDIKALQAVLTQKESPNVKKKINNEDSEKNLQEESEDNLLLLKPNLHDPSTSNTDENSKSTNPLAENDEYSDNECNDENDEHNGNLEDLTDYEAALHINRKIINLLISARNRLSLLLEECKKRQAIIDQKIRQKTTDPLSRTLLTIAGIPYFKDRQQFPAPKNFDAKLKVSRGELQIIDLPCPLKWTLKDRTTLWKAIYWNAKGIGEHGESLLNQNEDPLRVDPKFNRKKIPEEMINNLKELVGPLGSREFDWLRIAATDFNGRHSASECRAMWNVFLHPDINKGKWNKNEDSSLKLLAEKYKFQNWDLIADKLGTNRSGYQCFIKFNTNFKNDMLGKSSSWSKEEDQKLTDAVNTLRTGNFIPWGEVAKLIRNRKKQQIYMRWNYSLAPNLKKGRFTEEEDKLLLQGVSKFGFNFTKISVALMPHRNTAQLNDHYKTLMNEKKNEWNYEDDIKLVKLYDKFGNNWSAIAKEFSNKSRVQVRHRHAAIIRYLNRGLSVQTIPRWGKKFEEAETPDEIVTSGSEVLNEMSKVMTDQQTEHETERKEAMSKIDSELRDYFKGIYKTATKRGRNKKFYSVEELNKNIPRLEVVLELLNANLDIPDDFDEETNLAEKDKQLITALKTYSRNLRHESDTRQKHVEQFRRKMFGAAKPLTDADRFIPPLPFDGKVQRCKKKKLIGINYQSDGDKYLAEISNRFVTPENIIRLNGGFENEIEFETVEKIFIGKSVRRYDSNENDCDANIPSTSGMVLNENEIAANDVSSVAETRCQKLTKYYPEVIIPPNYATLLGFRGILLSKHILEAENSEEVESLQEDDTLTLFGKKALKLFEDRLIKLFKFPIELSEITPPLLHRLHDAQFNNLDTNTCKKKRKTTNKTGSGPAAKRKTKLEKINDAESSGHR